MSWGEHPVHPLPLDLPLFSTFAQVEMSIGQL